MLASCCSCHLAPTASAAGLLPKHHGTQPLLPYLVPPPHWPGMLLTCRCCTCDWEHRCGRVMVVSMAKGEPLLYLPEASSRFVSRRASSTPRWPVASQPCAAARLGDSLTSLGADDAICRLAASDGCAGGQASAARSTHPAREVTQHPRSHVSMAPQEARV